MLKKYIALLLLTCLAFRPAIAELPELGDPTKKSLSPYQEHLMGKNFYKALRSGVPFFDDLVVNDYLENLATRLVSHTDQPDKHYRFFIIQAPSINAFAGPNGYIGVHSGLFLAAQNESELAGVLAHEISHVTQRHLARAMTDSNTSPAAIFAAILAGILVSAQDPQAGAAIIYGGTAAAYQSQINFTRQNEHEADRVAVSILRDANINPEGMARFFETLLAQVDSNNELARMEYLSTHPLSTTRIAEAKNRLLQDDSKLPNDSLNFHLSQARILVSSASSIRDLVNRLEKSRDKNGDLITLYELAIAYIEFDRPSKAVELLKQIIAKQDHPWFSLALAKAYEKAQQYGQAKTLLQKLDQLYPGYLPVSIEYARVLINLDREKDAILILKRLSQQHNKPVVYQTLAQAYYTNNQIASALEATSYQYELEGYLKLAAQQVENALRQPDLSSNTQQRLSSRRDQLKQELQRELSRQ